MASPRILNINRNDIISTVPDLSKLTISGLSGDFSGVPFKVDQNEVQWNTSVQKFPGKKLQSKDIELTSSEGTITLRKAFWTSYSEGSLDGTCTHIHLKKNSPPSNDQIKFRSIIYLDKNPNLVFPHFTKDETGQQGSQWLPLLFSGQELNLFYLQGQNWIIFDGPTGLSFDQFQKLSGTARILFSYILGISLEQRSCELALSSDGKTVYEAWWYAGRNRSGNSYTPIPSSWGHWATAKRAIAIPQTMKHLDDTIMSTIWSNLLNWQDLLVPIEYLLTFPPAPVEMRGALLSVALESLTSCITEKYKQSAPKPLDDKATWKKFRDELNEILEEHGKTWGEDTKMVFTKRILDLNSPTNRSKLTAPFQHFGIELTEQDANAIQTRNDFLHRGRLLDEEERQKNDSWREVYHTEMRIYTLTNRLLLAALGYEGPIINWGDTILGGGQIQYLYQTPSPSIP